jgi:rRNA-processing protein FCF1
LAAKHLKALQTKLAEGQEKEGTSGVRTEGQEKEEISGGPKCGFAAERLKALQTKLAEGQEKEGTSGGRKCEEPMKGTEKPASSSASCSGFSKCGATTRLRVFKRKTILNHNIDPKQKCIEEGSFLSTKQHKSSGRGPELEERSPTCDISTCNRHTTHERYLDQSLSTQLPYLVPEEAMDWEPIADEKILLHIQEVRAEFQHNGGINLDRQEVDYGMNSISFTEGMQDWFIVLDTNILISSLTYIEELRDTSFIGLGFPVLVIPWQVLQELDILKARQCSGSSSLAARARRAISFLYSNFKSEHPRIRGQTALDSVPAAFKIEMPDDSILQCCLQIAQMTNRMILLSNDKNLCNKAIVNGIKAYQKSEIQQALEKLGSESVNRVQIQSSSGDKLSAEHMDISEPIYSLPVDKEATNADSVFCKLKSLLKEVLGKLLQNEMYKVYDTAWKNIVAVKPPWTLSDIIICLLKHWIAVFRFVLPAAIKPTLEYLNGVFASATQGKGYGNSLHEVKTILQASLHLCMAIHTKEYHDLVSMCLTDIKRLQKHCEETLRA